MGCLFFRALKANDIECRIGAIGDGWLKLLLYKDARCDMNILDDTVGSDNWQRSHHIENGVNYCTVSINKNWTDAEAEPVWVSKSDCGVPCYNGDAKGEASDSFKRACVNWGIGRELYSAPDIFIHTQTKNDQIKGWVIDGRMDFTVSNVEIDKKSNRITFLEISSPSRNGVVFTWGMKAEESRKQLEELRRQSQIRHDAMPNPRACYDVAPAATPSQEQPSNDYVDGAGGMSLNGKTRVRRF